MRQVIDLDIEIKTESSIELSVVIANDLDIEI